VLARRGGSAGFRPADSILQSGASASAATRAAVSRRCFAVEIVADFERRKIVETLETVAGARPMQPSSSTSALDPESEDQAFKHRRKTQRRLG